MIGYAMFGTNNLPRALTFYDGLMSVLSAKRLFGDGSDFYAAYLRDLEGNKFCVFKEAPAD
jgi:hypothetical protein